MKKKTVVGKNKKHSLRLQMMAINMVIALISLLICGMLFLLSIRWIGSEYIDSRLDFVVTQTSDNLDENIDYMEEIIYQIRDSEEIMDFLHSADSHSNISREKIENIFGEEIEITGDKNLSGNNEPVVEGVCLVDEDGCFFSEFYYALTYSDITEKNNRFQEALSAFNRANDSGFQINGESLYLTYILFDDDMNDCGTVIFEVNMTALQEPMTAVEESGKSFWVLYGGGEALSQYGEIEENDYADSDDVPYGRIYLQDNGDTSYRMYRQEYGLDFSIWMGISANQTGTMLYDSLKWYILGISVAILGGLISFAIFTYKMTRPLKEITDKIKQVQESRFDVRLPDYNSMEFNEISIAFNEMTEHIHHLINEVYEKQITVKELELKFYRSQLNPHFMFNMLNTIALQAKFDGDEEVAKMLTSFASLMQAKIYRNDVDKVKIRQELEYVEYYLYLQSFRFGDRLTYEIKIEDEGYLDYFIPKLCIQLIVENAVIHGIEPMLENGRVEIFIYEQDGDLFIDVADNGVGFGKEGEICFPVSGIAEGDAHNHVGLNNVHHIIQMMYGGKYGLKIESGDGTTVTIRIPFDSEM